MGFDPVSPRPPPPPPPPPPPVRKDPPPPPARLALVRSADTFTPAPAAAPPVLIDPRIATEAKVTLDIHAQTTGGAGSFDVATVRYQSDLNGESGGNHNVYVRVLDANGNEIPPEDLARWFDVREAPGGGAPETSGSLKARDPYGVQHDAWTNSQNSGGPSQGYFDVPIWGSDQARVWIAPRNVPGNPYAGFGSQSAGPFVMPGHHHVNYLVTFQARPGTVRPPAPPPPPPGPVPRPPPDLGAAQRRISGYAAGRDIGAPVDNGGGTLAHDWDGITVQDFAGGGETENRGRCMVVDGANGPKLVRNGFYQSYLGSGGEPPRPNHVRLGAPLDEEHWEGGQVVQHFEHGMMTWAPGKGVTVTADGVSSKPGVPPAPPAPPAGPLPVGDIVESVYQSELGRASDPGGKAGWVSFAQGLRNAGRSDAEIRDALVARFHQSDEYRAKHPAGPPPPQPPGPVGPVTNGSNAGPVYKKMFDSFTVAPGVTIPSHLGAHWGPEASYQDQGRIDAVADRMKQMGIGYCTVIVSSDNPGAQDKTLAALRARGIEPVVRFIVGGDYNKPLADYGPAELDKFRATVQHLRDAGVKMIELDNEPNLENLPHDGPAFDAAMRKYADTAAQMIAIVHREAPGMAVGLPPTAPTNDAFEQKLYKTMLGNLAAIDRTSTDPALRGHVFDRVFLATHPYGVGAPGDGPEANGRYRQWAKEATGRDFTTLATEGGNPRNGSDGQAAWGIQNRDFRWLGSHSGDTQCLWLIADGALTGRGGDQWERDAMIHPDGSVDPTLDYLGKIYRGEWNG